MADSIVYGINPVLELIRAERRKIEKVFILSGFRSPALKRISNLLKQRDIEIKYVPREFLGNISRSSEHQGVVALVEPFEFVGYKYFIQNQSDFERILIVNNVQDPHNLGAVIRSAYLFSFKGIIITKKNTVSITPAVIKASAGASEYVWIAVEENLPQAIIDLKRANYRIISLDVRGEIDSRSLKVDGPLALIVGGEDAGINDRLLSLSDYVVKIWISDNEFSLNLSVSAAIMMYQLSNKT
ncbi:MAG: 23S rRNA (guanosine(2251)-2'-O)-methyltransferase RlmB [Myxococcota bacterium]